MILNSFCIIVLSAAILMNSFTQSCHTKSIRALNDKLADLRLRFNSSRGKEEKIHAEKIRKENKDWCQEDSKIFEQNYLVCSPHASKLCSYLTDTEKGILMSVIRCCVDNSSGNDGYYFNNCCISNESYFTGFSYCYVPYSDMQNALKDLQNKYFWYAKNGEPWFFRIMLRKEEFPKEPIEILKDVLPSEEFKKLASLNQERLRCMAEADGLMGEVIEIESKLLVQLNKIRSIEAEIMLKSTSPKMQEADRACAYELINDSCIYESPEVRAYQAGLRPLRKEYPEQCHPSNKLVEAFKRYSRACWELL